jgi:hypothetical protein
MTVYVLVSQSMHEDAIVRGIYTNVPAVQAAEQELADNYVDEDCPNIYWEEKETDVLPVSGKKWVE